MSNLIYLIAYDCTANIQRARSQPPTGPFRLQDTTTLGDEIARSDLHGVVTFYASCIPQNKLGTSMKICMLRQAQLYAAFTFQCTCRLQGQPMISLESWGPTAWVRADWGMNSWVRPMQPSAAGLRTSSHSFPAQQAPAQQAAAQQAVSKPITVQLSLWQEARWGLRQRHPP